MKNQFQSEQGVSILLAVMILSVVLSIALGSSGVAIRQTQSMDGIGDSVVAFYAADHGVEKVLMMDIPTIEEGGELVIEGDDLTNGATYKVVVTDNTHSDCSADSYCIKSTGFYGQAKRAISTVY